MFVPSQGTRRLESLPTRELPADRPSNQVARERIAEFRQKLHTGMLDGGEEALEAAKGKRSALKLGDFS